MCMPTRSAAWHSSSHSSSHLTTGSNHRLIGRHRSSEAGSTTRPSLSVRCFGNGSRPLATQLVATSAVRDAAPEVEPVRRPCACPTASRPGDVPRARHRCLRTPLCRHRRTDAARIGGSPYQAVQPVGPARDRERPAASVRPPHALRPGLRHRHAEAGAPREPEESATSSRMAVTTTRSTATKSATRSHPIRRRRPSYSSGTVTSCSAASDRLSPVWAQRGFNLAWPKRPSRKTPLPSGS